ALLTSQRGSDGIIGLVPHLDGDFGVSEQVMIPVRVGWRAAFGGEDEQALAIAQVHRRVGAALAALCSGGREQKQRPAFPHAADLSFIGPERLNRLAIPVIPVRHISSSIKNRCRPSRHPCWVRGSFYCHFMLAYCFGRRQ